LVRIWDTATGKPVGVLRGPPGKDLGRGITALAVTPDGQFLATADGNQTLRLWDLKRRRPVHTMVGANARHLAFTPDGRVLMSAGGDHDRSVRLWDVATGKERRRLLWNKFPASSLACTADGRTVVSTDADDWGKVYLADLATGALRRSLGLPAAPKGSWGRAPDVLAFAPGAKALAFESSFQWKKPERWEHRACLIDLATGKELRRFDGLEKGLNALAFSPDGKVLASASWDRTIRLWDAAMGKELRKIPGTNYHTRRLVFAPDGKTLASVGGDSTIHLWDVSTGKEFQRREGPRGAIASVAFSPDGRIVATCCSYGEEPPAVRLWDAATGKPLRALLGHRSYVRSAAFLPGGKVVLSSGGDGTLRVWEVATGKQVRMLRLPENEQVTAMALSADGKVLAVRGLSTEREEEFAGWITVWDVRAGKVLSRRKGDPYGGGLVSFSPDARSVAQIGPGGIVVRDVAAGTELHRLLMPDAAQHGYAFSPDGKRLAVPCRKVGRDGSRVWYEDCAVRVFELSTGKEKVRIPTGAYCRGLCFSPDGRSLAWAGDEAVAVFDAASGKELLRRAVEEGNVRALAFSPDGRRLVTGLSNATALIWDVTRKGARGKR
jgi:WD40 repeat protein